jgi:hypothetical protein
VTTSTKLDARQPTSMTLRQAPRSPRMWPAVCCGEYA